MKTNELDIPVKDVLLKGDLTLPEKPKGLIIFSHGSGSSRLSPRNRFVAKKLQEAEFATLLFDLLTPREDAVYERRFDIELLTQRLSSVTHWVTKQPFYHQWSIGYFGASTGAASALKSAADLGPETVKAVVSRGGRPDLTMDELDRVESPVLLIIGGFDVQVIRLNKLALEKLDCIKQIQIIPGASHLFEERGKLEQVTNYASDWFLKYLYKKYIRVEKDFMK